MNLKVGPVSDPKSPRNPWEVHPSHHFSKPCDCLLEPPTKSIALRGKNLHQPNSNPKTHLAVPLQSMESKDATDFAVDLAGAMLGAAGAAGAMFGDGAMFFSIRMAMAW